MRITENQLRQIIREVAVESRGAAGRRPVRLQLDISYDHPLGNPVNGQDVTDLFSRDIAPPLKATIIDADGPAGGPLFVEFEFRDIRHARAWAIDNEYVNDDEEFQLALV